MAEIENVVIIDRFDYDELVEKARMTDEEIKKEAERIFMQENGVLVRIEFNEYPNSKKLHSSYWIYQRRRKRRYL